MSPKLRERRPLNSGSFFMCYVVRIPPVPSPASPLHFLCVLMCFFFLTTKPIYAQLDLLLRGTIHVFMTGCLLRISTLRIAVAFLINIKCAQATHKGNAQSQEKVSLCSTQSTQEWREGGGQEVSCLYVHWAGHTTVLQRSIHCEAAFDLLVKKLKFYGLFFARCPAYRFAVKDSNSSRLSEASPPSPPPPLMA